jgi:hypothetical protein
MVFRISWDHVETWNTSVFWWTPVQNVSTVFISEDTVEDTGKHRRMSRQMDRSRFRREVLMPTITAPVRNGGYLVLKDVQRRGRVETDHLRTSTVTEGNIAKKNTRFQNQRWWNKVPARKRTGVYDSSISSYVSVDDFQVVFRSKEIKRVIISATVFEKLASQSGRFVGR